MKKYIKDNWEPIMVGIAVGLLCNAVLSTVHSTIIKIVLIHQGVS